MYGIHETKAPRDGKDCAKWKSAVPILVIIMTSDMAIITNMLLRREGMQLLEAQGLEVYTHVQSYAHVHTDV